MTDPSRLDLIEIKLAHMERAITELSDALLHQQREIDLLSAQNRRLNDHLETINAGSEADAHSFEKPPHY